MNIVATQGNLYPIKRINWIDWAKFLAITFVVFGHLPEKVSPPSLVLYVCTFHMAFFFFISGYLSNWRGSFSIDMKKQLHVLVIPYFIYNLVFYPYWLVRYVMDGGPVDFFHVVIRPFAGTLMLQYETVISTPLNGVTWFLVALFFMRVIFNLCYLSKKSILWLVIVSIGSFIIYCIDAMLSLFHNYVDVNFFICFPFFILGYLIKKTDFFDGDAFVRDSLLSLSLIGISVMFYIVLQCGVISGNCYILIKTVIQLTAILGMICLCRLLNTQKFNFVVNVSLGTLLIMGLHWMLIGVMNFGFEKLFCLSRGITYDWYVAIILSLLIELLLYPIILFAQKNCLVLIGKTKR